MADPVKTMTINSNGNKMAFVNAGSGALSNNKRIKIEMVRPYSPSVVAFFHRLCLTSIRDVFEAKRKMNNRVKGRARKDKSTFN